MYFIKNNEMHKTALTFYANHMFVFAIRVTFYLGFDTFQTFGGRLQPYAPLFGR